MATGALGSVSNRLRHENGDTHVVICDDAFSDAGSTPAASTIRLCSRLPSAKRELRSWQAIRQGECPERAQRVEGLHASSHSTPVEGFSAWQAIRQSFLGVEPIEPLLAQLPSFTAHQHEQPAIAKAHARLRQLAQPLPYADQGIAMALVAAARSTEACGPCR